MSIFVGVDAGGTKTAVVVADGERIIGRAFGPPGSVRAGRALQAASRIASAVRTALTEAKLIEADVLVVGAAGAGREPERGELREGLRTERLAQKVIVTGDLDIALEAAFGQGPGIVLVSGTGSVVVGRTPTGAIHRRGGYGWQMGDEGSGYAIGRAALQAVGKTQDRRGAGTAIAALLMAGPPKRTFEERVRWSNGAEPGEVAGVSEVVGKAAEAGDAVAKWIMDRAADDLTTLATSLLAEFGDLAPVPIALAGGNIEPGRGLRSFLESTLRAVPRLAVSDVVLRPAEGALALARRA
ncbi:MAG: hypothetical protein HOP28_15235 [Gemmatimonadales bacterium]|nr:hypothetical protein [Gemmatimonadales bacterium]